MLKLDLFGPPEITANGVSVSAVRAQPKRLALLVYLTLAESKSVYRRDTLVALFWPDRPEDLARAALSRATHFLRQALGAELIVGRSVEELGIDRTRLTCDVLEFDRLRAAGDLPAAMTLYRGDLLPGFHVDDAPEFMRWLDDERVRRRNTAAQCATELARRATNSGDSVDACAWAERALQLAPCDEQAAQLLLEALVARGDRSGALRAYDNFCARLAADLELTPSVALRAVADDIRRNVANLARTGAHGDGVAARVDASPAFATKSVVTPIAAHAADVAAPSMLPVAPARVAVRAVRQRRWGTVGVASLLLLTAGALAWRRPAPDDGRLMLGEKARLTHSTHVVMSTVSPDGKQLAYAERQCDARACESQLLVRDLDGLKTRVLMDSISDLRFMKWSPDRRTVMFYGRYGTEEGAWLQDVIGGAPRLVGKGPADFFADGDSVLVAPYFHGDSSFTLRVATRDGIVRDSLMLRVPGGGISWLSTIPGSPYFVALVTRPPRGWWQVFDRTGRLVDHVENACVCGGHASSHALWLSRPGGPAGEMLVRIAFDPSTGHIGTRQDTILHEASTAFSSTADGTRLVADIAQLETTVWLPTVQDLFSGADSGERRIEHGTQSASWSMSPDGTKLLVVRTVAVDTRTTFTAAIRQVNGGAETPLAIPGELRAVHWADSVTVDFRARSPGDTLFFGLVDVRDGRVRERFVPGLDGVWAHARIADGWAWILPGGRRVQVMVRGVRHDWPAPVWFNQLYGLGGGTGVRTPVAFGADHATGDSVGVVAFDPATGHFETWLRRRNEGQPGLQVLGDGRMLLRTRYGTPFNDYTLLTGPGRDSLVGTVRRPDVSASFSADLSRAVAIESRINADAWMYEVRKR